MDRSIYEYRDLADEEIVERVACLGAYGITDSRERLRGHGFKLKHQQFDHLPHENQEFKEGPGAMRDAVADESLGFKASVLTTLEATLAAARHLANASRSHDTAQVKAAIDALADSMHTLNGLFPEALRSEPGPVPAPRHGGPAAQ